MVVPNYAAIGVGKAMAESLMRYLAVELAPKGIRINAITPGIVETDAVRSLFRPTTWCALPPATTLPATASRQRTIPAWCVGWRPPRPNSSGDKSYSSTAARISARDLINLFGLDENDRHTVPQFRTGYGAYSYDKR